MVYGKENSIYVIFIVQGEMEFTTGLTTIEKTAL